MRKLTEAQRDGLTALDVAHEQHERARRSSTTDYTAATTPTVHYRAADVLVEAGLAEAHDDETYSLTGAGHAVIRGHEPTTEHNAEYDVWTATCPCGWLDGQVHTEEAAAEQAAAAHLEECARAYDEAVGRSGDDRPLVEEHEGTRSDGRALPTTIRVKLHHLLDAGLLTAGETLECELDGHQLTATVAADGQVERRGKRYSSPSTAGKRARAEVEEEPKATNGWEFWKVDRDGELVPLYRLRDEYLAEHTAEEAA